jgi:hypothetical protein
LEIFSSSVTRSFRPCPLQPACDRFGH